jgi:acyl-coenzyme A thioesterase PaaI-like protein
MPQHPLNTPIGRFRIETIEEGAAGCVATMPVHDLVNPVTGALSLAPLARADDPLTTATLRVNFLRQFFAGDQSRYVGTALRVGRRTGVAESKAVGADGKVAIIARMTAYRC